MEARSQLGERIASENFIPREIHFPAVIGAMATTLHCSLLLRLIISLSPVCMVA